MSIDRIKAFVERLKPELVCDDCIADRLDIPAAAVATAIHELVGRSEFERTIGACALCQENRLTTRAR